MWGQGRDSRCFICMCICWGGGIWSGLRGKIKRMFSFPQPASRRRRASLLFSLADSLRRVVFVAAPRTDLREAFVGGGGSAWVTEVVTYFPSAQEVKPAKKKSPLRFSAKAVVARKNLRRVRRRSGTEFGSVGSVTGTEARPALPVVFPDPAIFPWQLPNGLTGDVIVEVTIDDQGAVTDTRLLQSLKPDIDQKVVATVRNWRFRPATVDGVAISSRQDVHFHYPS